MLTKRVIPCLDVRDGRVVKGVRFGGLMDSGDPVELARRYARQGADELVVLDVSATAEGRAAAIRTVEAIRAVLDIPLCVGGGVRTLADALVLVSAGADKVAVNTAAVLRPSLLTEMANAVGRQCVVVSIDAGFDRDACAWRVVTHAGTRRTPLDAVAWAIEACALGAGEVLLTSWDRDGTKAGYDLGLIAAVCSGVRAPVIASGGARTTAHMREAFEAGASAVLAASILHEGESSIECLKWELHQYGVGVRT